MTGDYRKDPEVVARLTPEQRHNAITARYLVAAHGGGGRQELRRSRPAELGVGQHPFCIV